MNKTRKEWFKDLPLQKRLQATENVRRCESHYNFSLAMSDLDNSLSSSLAGAFDFSNVKQRHNYWWGITMKAQKHD